VTRQEQTNSDWTALASSWQSIDEQPSIAPRSLIEKVHREERRRRAWGVVEVLFSVAAIVATVVLLVLRPQTSSGVIAIDTWVVLGVVWFFALSSDAGLSLTAGISTAEYLGLARRYALRRLHTVYLALGLLLGQMIVLGVLMTADARYRDVSYIQVGAVITWLVWAARSRRKALIELNDLDQMGPDLRS